MAPYTYPLRHIGILGGGQLARMMIYEARKLGFAFSVLETSDDAPACQIADEVIIGDLYDREKIAQLVRAADITTYDIEHIDTEILHKLEEEGCIIRPAPRILETIQDKLVQKTLLKEAGIPVPAFEPLDDPKQFSPAGYTFPIVQKVRRGGYDGRGVFIAASENDCAGMISAPSILEEYVDFSIELAVVTARDINGNLHSYPAVEMYFNSEANICEMIVAPARISSTAAAKAREIAEAAVTALNGTGVFAVEMFLTENGTIKVNEIAPRPHNSGHITMEACVTGQFEQHIRAVSGMPLGSTDLLRPAVMRNILGSGTNTGPPRITGLEEALSVDGCSIHFYGKQLCKPYRKMGHFTVTDRGIEEALKKAAYIQDILRIEGE